jgi:hypothetical protein
VELKDWVQSVERFFNDIIGVLVPGFVSLLACKVAFGLPIAVGGNGFALIPARSTDWVFLLAASYIAGQVVIGLGEAILVPTLETILRSWLGRHVKRVFPRMRPQEEVTDELRTRPAWTTLLDILSQRTGTDWHASQVTLGEMRNIAMSYVTEQRPTVYKFMFISQLSLGIATSILATMPIWLVRACWTCIVARQIGPLQGWPWMVALSAVAFILLERRYRFYNRSLELPLSMFVGEIIRPEQPSTKT